MIYYSLLKLVFIAPALYKIICFLCIFKAIVFHDTHYYIVLISYLIFNAWFKTIKQLHADEQLTIYKTIVILGLSYYLYINVFPFFRKNLQSTKFRFFGTWYKINTFIFDILPMPKCREFLDINDTCLLK